MSDFAPPGYYPLRRYPDLPLNIHPAAIRVSAVDTPFGAV